MFLFKGKKIVLCIIILFLAFFVFNHTAIAGSFGLNETMGAEQGGVKLDDILQKDDIPTTIGKVIGAVLAFIGILFFILMIYGGVTWMTARGNEQAVTKAKELIISAVIGLIIVLAAYAITSYIGTQLTTPSPTLPIP